MTYCSLEHRSETSAPAFSARVNILCFPSLLAGGDLAVWKGHHFKGLTHIRLARKHTWRIIQLCSGFIRKASGGEAMTGRVAMSSPRPGNVSLWRSCFVSGENLTHKLPELRVNPPETWKSAPDFLVSHPQQQCFTIAFQNGWLETTGGFPKSWRAPSVNLEAANH